MPAETTGGFYMAPAPNAIFVFRGQYWVTPDNTEDVPPHDEPPASVTATQFELVEGPHNQLPRE